MNIDILLDSDANDAEVAAVKAVLAEEGINGSIEATWSIRGLGEYPWVIFLLVALRPFYKSFLSEAGKDAYQGLRRLICKLFRARRDSNGTIEVCDDNTETHIFLADDLPEEAYRQLTQKGLEQLKGGYWIWDSNLEEWTQH